MNVIMLTRGKVYATFAILAFASTLLSGDVFVAFAQTAGSGTFSVRPAKLELSIPPGGEITRTIDLGNGTAFPITVSVSFEDIAGGDQGDATQDPIVLLGKNGGAYPLRELLSVESRTLTLRSGETRQVPVTVRIPSGVAPGGHYGSVVFTFTPSIEGLPAGQESIAVESRIATLLFVRVEGDVREEGKLEKFGLFNDVRFVSASERDPLRFQVAYTNRGTVHLNPYGRVTLSALWGGGQEAIIDPWVVLPGATRFREIDIHGVKKPGYYTAHLEQNRGYGDVIDTAEVHFIVLPTFAQGVVILLVLIALVWLIRRSLTLSRNFIS